MTNEVVTQEDIARGTQGVFTSRLGMEFAIRVAKDTKKGSARIEIQYMRSRDISIVPVSMVSFPVMEPAQPA